MDCYSPARGLAFGGINCLSEGSNSLKSSKFIEEVQSERKFPVGSDFVRRSLMVEVRYGSQFIFEAKLLCNIYNQLILNGLENYSFYLMNVYLKSVLSQSSTDIFKFIFLWYLMQVKKQSLET